MESNESMLQYEEVSYEAFPEFVGDLNRHEALMTDLILSTSLPAFREGKLLEDRLSVVKFDSEFASFIQLPEEWTGGRGLDIDSTDFEGFMKQHFPELNVNYTYPSREGGIFRLKVVMHYDRQSALFQAVAVFDRNAYIWGEFPGEKLV